MSAPLLIAACSVLALLVLSGAVQMAFAHGVVDQFYDDVAGISTGVSSERLLIQTFTPAADNICGADVFLSAPPNPPVTMDLTLVVLQEESGSLGSKTQSITVTSNSSLSPDVVHFDFDSPIPLTPDSTANLTLVDTAGGETTGVFWSFNGYDNPYAGGQGYIEHEGAPEDPPGLDFLFRTYSCQKPVGGETLPVEMSALFVSGAFTNAYWILPVVAGVAVAGAALAASRIRK